ncbi:hypothetical protein VTN02DRAFT_3648 [Thermoascus thermophilus]
MLKIDTASGRKNFDYGKKGSTRRGGSVLAEVMLVYLDFFMLFAEAEAPGCVLRRSLHQIVRQALHLCRQPALPSNML